MLCSLSYMSLPVYMAFSDTDSTGQWVVGGGALSLMGRGRSLPFCWASIDTREDSSSMLAGDKAWSPLAQ